MFKKITIIGIGNVGSTIAFTLAINNICSNILLIDIDNEKAKQEAFNINQSFPFIGNTKVYSGMYDDARESEIVIITCGINCTPQISRLELAKVNTEIIKNIASNIAFIVPNAFYIVVSNPVDVITYEILKNSSLEPKKVFGTGTLLDTMRLKLFIADYLGINPKIIEGYVIGEHGDSSVISYSNINIQGYNFFTYLKRNEITININKLEEYVRFSGRDILKRKKHTNYAISIAVLNICYCLNSTNYTILPLSSLYNYYSSNICIGYPVLINKNGIKSLKNFSLTKTEALMFEKSCRIIRKYCT